MVLSYFLTLLGETKLKTHMRTVSQFHLICQRNDNLAREKWGT